RIVLAAVDQVEHLRGREFYENGLADFGHERGCCRSVLLRLPTLPEDASEARHVRTHTPALMSLLDNRQAFHDYFIEEKFEAGMVLQGWEVKGIRAGRANIKESYVIVRDGELFLLGMHITPLSSASTHVKPDPVRTRKLLLHAREIAKLIGKVERAGYALVPLDLHYSKGRIKLSVGLAKGKKQFDKRETEKNRDWEREKARMMRVKA